MNFLLQSVRDRLRFVPGLVPIGNENQTYFLEIEVDGIDNRSTEAFIEIVQGDLPLGLSSELNLELLPVGSLSFTIFGTPTESGNFKIRLRAGQTIDNNTETIFKDIIIIIQPSNELEIITNFLPSGQIGLEYSATLTAFGGLSPYVWTISSGDLPPGLSLKSSNNNENNIIEGVPTTSGMFNFVAKVTDNSSESQTQNLSINVIEGFPSTSSNIFDEWWFWALIVIVLLVIVIIISVIFWNESV